MNLEDVIRKPLLTEKAVRQAEKVNEVCFAVNPSANKVLIRLAVEKFFQVKVAAVRTANMNGKRKRFGKNYGRTSDWKKAFVRLKGKETIKLFEGK